VLTSSSTAAHASSNASVLPWPQPTDGGHTHFNPTNSPLLQPSSTVVTTEFCCQHCLPLPHSPSHLSQVNKHQLSILANADEVVSPSPRSFRIC
jgi:hypothetical protein